MRAIRAAVLLAAAWTALLPAAGRGQDPRKMEELSRRRQVAAELAQDALGSRSVLAGGAAYVLLPAELACGPAVAEAKWSSDGRFVLALCRDERLSAPAARARALRREPGDPPGDLRLVVWGRDGHRSQDLWRRPIGRARVEEFRWLPASDCALAIVVEAPLRPGAEARRRVLWMRAGAAAARFVADIPCDRPPPNMVTSPLNRIEISPSRPLAVIVNGSIRVRSRPRADGSPREIPEWQDAVTPLRDDGSPGATLQMPGVSFLTWSASGRTCYLQRTEWPADPDARPVMTWFEYDPRTGQVLPLPGEPANLPALLDTGHGAPGGEAAPAGPVRLVSSPAEARQGAAGAPVRPLWLVASGQGEQPGVLVCADAGWSQLSPAKDAALYVAQGAAWVRPILQVSAADYAAMRREEARRQAVADAEALSMALLAMVDSGEYYPRPDQLRDWLGPYLKDSVHLLDRLVYTPGAKQLLPAEQQATTVMGYVTGPGGRAVIYADGRAVWQDD